MVSASRCGSLASSGLGRPVLTLQNRQRRVHLSPMIMKVAVPLLQHSPMLGQDASSHTVTNWWARTMSLITLKRPEDDAALTRIQFGLGSLSVARFSSRLVLREPLCWSGRGLVGDACGNTDTIFLKRMVSMFMTLVSWLRRSSCGDSRRSPRPLAGKGVVVKRNRLLARISNPSVTKRCRPAKDRPSPLGRGAAEIGDGSAGRSE